MTGNMGRAALATSIALAALASIVMALRLWARKLTKMGTGTDDYLTGATLVLMYAMLVVTILVTRGGLGQDVTADQEQRGSAEILLKCLFVLALSYGLASPLIKLAILYLYRRIFPSRLVDAGSRAIGAVVIAWGVATELTSVLACRPVARIWDPGRVPGDCIDNILFYTAIAGINLGLDVCIVLLPLPDLLRLRMTLRDKVAVVGLFVLGGIVFVVSSIRLAVLAALLRSGVTDMNQQYVLPWLMGNVEISVAIVGACLPTLVPVFRRILHVHHSRSRSEPSQIRSSARAPRNTAYAVHVNSVDMVQGVQRQEHTNTTTSGIRPPDTGMENEESRRPSADQRLLDQIVGGSGDAEVNSLGPTEGAHHELAVCK